MEISKGLQEEILAVQNKLKNAIRDHQICVGKLKDDPNNTDILAQIQKIHLHIVSLGRCQKQVVQRLRKEVEAFKAENANGAKVSIASLLGLNNNNHITNNNETKRKSPGKECTTNPSKENYEHIVRNGDVPSPTQDTIPPKERPRSVETISGEDDVIEVSMDENSNEKVEEPEKECKDEAGEKLNFLCALGLITTSRYAELQNKRAERKRRSTANPQFVYASLEAPAKRKRHSYLQSSGSAPQTRQTTARMNGPSPPPAKTVPAKSTSPPTRTVMKSLIPVQKSTTRPNILRNVTESKVFVNKTKLENGSNQTPLPIPTATKPTQTTVGSKTVHIPGLPSSLTIERIESDSAVCISCRNPGTLTVCENCTSNYHVSCHSVSPAPPRICPKCAQLDEDDGGEGEEQSNEQEDEKMRRPLKKDLELATATQTPGIIRKTREDTEVYKTPGGLHKVDATQKTRGITTTLGINQLPSSTFLIPISSNNNSTTNLNQPESSNSIITSTNNNEQQQQQQHQQQQQQQRGNPVSYSPIVISTLPQPNITYIQPEPQVSYSYQLGIGNTPSEKHQSYLIVQQISDTSRRSSQSGEDPKNKSMLNSKRPGTGSRHLPIQPKISVSNSPILFSQQLPDTINRNCKKSTSRAVPALNRIFNTENISVASVYQLGGSTVNGRKPRGKQTKSKLNVNPLRTTKATDILLPSYNDEKSDGQLQITKSNDTEDTSILSGHAKYKQRSSGLFHSLFTGHNKSYIVTDSPRESGDSNTIDKEHPTIRQQLYNQDHQLESSQSNESSTQLQRGALTKFFEHVKLEEAHLPAPPRAKLVYKSSVSPEKGELIICENSVDSETADDYRSGSNAPLPSGNFDQDKTVKQSSKQSNTLLMMQCHNNDSVINKGIESLSSVNGTTARLSDFVTYEHKHGSTYVMIQNDPQKMKNNSTIDMYEPELSVLRCVESTPDTWRDRKSSVSLYNAQSNLLELRNEVSVPDNKAETERQDFPSGRCSSSSSSASQSDTPEQAMQGSIERLGIGTVSPESMQVLEQFESAMLEADHSNAATC